MSDKVYTALVCIANVLAVVAPIAAVLLIVAEFA